MLKLASISCALLLSAIALSQEDPTGDYPLISDSPDVSGMLSLHNDGTFMVKFKSPNQSAIRFGEYDVDGTVLRLRFRRGNKVDGTIEGKHVDFDGRQWGQTTERNGSTVIRPKPVTPDTSNGIVVPAIPVAVPSLPTKATVFTATVSAIVPVTPPKPVIKLTREQFVGYWTVRRNGLEDKSCRIEFRGNGTFRFAGQGATSEGKFEVQEDEVEFTWTRIDGEDVTDGQIRKRFKVTDELGFFIDQFRYERAGQ